jgi:hypothetical protein
MVSHITRFYLVFQDEAELRQSNQVDLSSDMRNQESTSNMFSNTLSLQ